VFERKRSLRGAVNRATLAPVGPPCPFENASSAPVNEFATEFTDVARGAFYLTVAGINLSLFT